MPDCNLPFRSRARRARHGLFHHPLHSVWTTMIMRCTNPNHDKFKYYGGRGITVCDRWLESFVHFLDDMGERPLGTSLDRIDNSVGYSPANCRWATREVQGANKRNNHLLTHDGVTMSVACWARRTGLKRGTIEMRLNAGWTVADTLSRPLVVLVKADSTKRNRENARRQRLRNPQADRERKRRWEKTHRDQRRASQRRWYRANKEKVHVHNCVAWALKQGRLIRPKCCESCGLAKRLLAHHDDYRKPLDVKWWCARCHNHHHFLIAA